ncbi:MAG: hypothetical protein PHP64_01405 [Actinomycetota bacterium]|nr:hypothetical protein [Actinomycetota bacterium]
MKFSELQEIVDDEPVFETGLLIAGRVNPAEVRRQLSRFTASGRLIQLRRGLYVLAPPYRKTTPHPFLIANRMVHASYVSRHSALEFHGLIPEHVPVVTSVTTSRPGFLKTPLGDFDYRHVKRDFFHGYRAVDLGNKQTALVATPEKALLDIAYLQPESDNRGYLSELRLQNMERFDFEELERIAVESGSRKLRRVTSIVADIAREQDKEYELL